MRGGPLRHRREPLILAGPRQRVAKGGQYLAPGQLWTVTAGLGESGPQVLATGQMRCV